MEEKRYLSLADTTFRAIIDGFDSIDMEDADVESSGDVITIIFRDGNRCVINTQRPTRQIWVAGGTRAWHFDYDEASNTWIDSKSGTELFSTLKQITSDAIGIEPTL